MKDIGYNDILTPNTHFLPLKVVQAPRDLIKTFSHTKRVGNYLLGKTLGEGSFAKVKEALHVPTGEKVAVKVIDKKRARSDSYVRKNLRREGKLLQMIRHPNVVKLLEIMETENSYYLVTELCQGGDFMDYICKKKRLEENEGKKYVRQIVSAVDYLHRLGILHRDLKIENLLLDSNKDIKIIDFGLSNSIKVSTTAEGTRAQEYCVTQCGSPAYAAPELLSHQKYGPQVDVWSIGVNMFAMLTGSLPFTVEPFNIKALYNKMVLGHMNPIPDHLSNECRDLLRKFLTPDPEKRVTITDVMRHVWLSGGETGKFDRHPCPNKLKTEELDSNLLKHMCHNLGFKMGELVRFCTGNIPSAANATYQLFIKRLKRYNADTKVKGKASMFTDNRQMEPTRISLVFNELSQKHVTVPPTGLKLLKRRGGDNNSDYSGGEERPSNGGGGGGVGNYLVTQRNKIRDENPFTPKSEGVRIPLKDKTVNTGENSSPNKHVVLKTSNMQRVLCANPTWLRKTCHLDKKTMSEELSSLNKLLSPRIKVNTSIDNKDVRVLDVSEAKPHLLVNESKISRVPETRSVMGSDSNRWKSPGGLTSRVHSNINVDLKTPKRYVQINHIPVNKVIAIYTKSPLTNENTAATKRPMSPFRKRTPQLSDSKKIRTIGDVDQEKITHENNPTIIGRLSDISSSRGSVHPIGQSEDSASNLILPNISQITTRNH